MKFYKYQHHIAEWLLLWFQIRIIFLLEKNKIYQADIVNI